MTVIYLMWLIVTGDGFIAYYQPQSSQTACDTARQGVKFAPSAPSAVSGTDVNVSAAGVVAVVCVTIPQVASPVYQYPQVTP